MAFADEATSLGRSDELGQVLQCNIAASQYLARCRFVKPWRSSMSEPNEPPKASVIPYSPGAPGLNGPTANYDESTFTTSTQGVTRGLLRPSPSG
jgi:hypothetical protein